MKHNKKNNSLYVKANKECKITNN